MIDSYRNEMYCEDDDDSLSPNGRDNHSSKFSTKELNQKMNKLAVTEKKFNDEKLYKED